MFSNNGGGRSPSAKGGRMGRLNSTLWETVASSLPGAFLEVRAPEGPSYRPRPVAKAQQPELVRQSSAVSAVSRAEERRASDESLGRGGMSRTSSSASQPPSDEAPLSHGDMRAAMFQAELSKRRIQLTELQKLAAQGIPDEGSIRSITWKLLLGYLPKNREDWEKELAKKRAQYAQFRQELIINPSEVSRRRSSDATGDGSEEEALTKALERQTLETGDHPLNVGGSSVWHQFFKDTEVAQQIERDVQRTHPDMHFFNGEDEAASVNQAALRRVLFIFAKLNAGIRYVQGMNEVLAPLYWIFRTDPDTSSSVHAEADAFFCFVELLSEFRDHFCQQLDNSEVGIRSTIARLSALLRRQDEELWRHLDQITKVNPQFYAFRWITLLLTQEFSFPDILRLWDSLLSNPDGSMEILLRICCAMLVCVRERLLAGDFTTNLKLLQHYPSLDVNNIIRLADQYK